MQAHDPRTFYMRKHNDFSGGWQDRHINLQWSTLHEKTQRFLRGWRECTRTFHVNLQSRWRPGAFYMRKHNDFSNGRGILHEKTQRFLRGWRECTRTFHLKSKWSPGAFYTKNTTIFRRRRDAHVHCTKIYSRNEAQAHFTREDFSAVGGGLRRGRILIRNRDGVMTRFYISNEKYQVSFIPTRPPTTYVHTRFCPQHDYWWCLFTTRRFHKSHLLIHTHAFPQIISSLSHMTQRRLYLQCSWSTYAFVPALKLPGNSAGAGSITCEFTLTCEPKTHCTWDNTMKVNPRNVARFLRCAFSWQKNRSVGAVGRGSYKFTGTLHARCVLLKKTHGIWKDFRDARFSWKKIRNPGAVGRGSYEFTVTRNARRIVPEKTQGIWGVGTARIFHWKTQRFLRELAGVTNKFTVKMKPRRTLHKKTWRSLPGWREWQINLQSRWRSAAFYMRKHNDFSVVGGGLRRGCIFLGNRDSRSLNLPTWSMLRKILGGGGVGCGDDHVLLRHMLLHTCPNLWCNSCSKCYGMDCFRTYFTHVQTCDVTRVQSATEWTASVHTSHMSKPVM